MRAVPEGWIAVGAWDIGLGDGSTGRVVELMGYAGPYGVENARALPGSCFCPHSVNPVGT